MRRRRHRNDQSDETAVNEPIPDFSSASAEKSAEGSFAKDSRRIQAEGDGRAAGVHWPKRSDFPDPRFRKRQRRKISGRFVRQRLPANPSRRRRTSRWSPLAQAERLSGSLIFQAPAQKNQRKVRSPKTPGESKPKATDEPLESTGPSGATFQIPVFASISAAKSAEGSFAKDSRRIQAEGDGRAAGVHWPKRSDFPDPHFRKHQRRKISGRFVRQRYIAPNFRNQEDCLSV
jgi:hypothetical protein